LAQQARRQWQEVWQMMMTSQRQKYLFGVAKNGVIEKLHNHTLSRNVVVSKRIIVISRRFVVAIAMARAMQVIAQ